MKLSKLRVSIELSNGSWIDVIENQDEQRIFCGKGREDNFDEALVLGALKKLKEAILE